MCWPQRRAPSRRTTGKGFEKLGTETFDLAVDQTQSIDVVLKIGDVNQSVTVLSQTSMPDFHGGQVRRCAIRFPTNLPYGGPSFFVARRASEQPILDAAFLYR